MGGPLTVHRARTTLGSASSSASPTTGPAAPLAGEVSVSHAAGQKLPGVVGRRPQDGRTLVGCGLELGDAFGGATADHSVCGGEGAPCVPSGDGRQPRRSARHVEPARLGTTSGDHRNWLSNAASYRRPGLPNDERNDAAQLATSQCSPDAGVMESPAWGTLRVTGPRVTTPGTLRGATFAAFFFGAGGPAASVRGTAATAPRRAWPTAQERTDDRIRGQQSGRTQAALPLDLGHQVSR